MHFVLVPFSQARGASVVTRKRLVIGIGNPDRGDDAVGSLVVRRLGGRVPSSVFLIERNGDALALIDDWAGSDAVVLVDAAAPRGSPGRIYRAALMEDTLLAEL